MIVLAKMVSNINLKTATIPAKSLILVAWLGPGRVSADRYIKVLKIQMEIRNDWRQVKIILINYHHLKFNS